MMQCEKFVQSTVNREKFSLHGYMVSHGNMLFFPKRAKKIGGTYTTL